MGWGGVGGGRQPPPPKGEGMHMQASRALRLRGQPMRGPVRGRPEEGQHGQGASAGASGGARWFRVGHPRGTSPSSSPSLDPYAPCRSVKRSKFLMCSVSAAAAASSFAPPPLPPPGPPPLSAAPTPPLRSMDGGDDNIEPLRCGEGSPPAEERGEMGGINYVTLHARNGCTPPPPPHALRH